MVALLKLSNVVKSFGVGSCKRYILNGLNFELLRGEFIALIGASGTGKSTFLHIAGLLDNFEEGEVFINGKNCSKLSDIQKSAMRLKNIGFIYQFHHLLAEFTVEENLIIPQLINNISYNKAQEIALQTLKSFTLSDKANRFAGELSGGEQQRVAIGRSLVNYPAIILADEPTGNLDEANAYKVVNLLRQIVEQSNISVIMVTHNIKLAKIADRVITISDGKISC